MVPSASALQDLKITNDNLATLQSLTGNSGAWYSYGVGFEPQLLKYNYGNNLNTYDGSKTAVYVGTMKAIKIRDGQCVLFANAMANRNGIIASNWKRGRSVIWSGESMPQGTFIATFKADGTYDYLGTNGKNHVAIFDRWHMVYLGNYRWQIDGFYVWDQNYVSPLLVGRHLIKQTGSSTGDADNYYVVQVP